MSRRNITGGFTLTELAIVVVVIAIIIAGVLAGDEILEGAKRQSVIKEISKYTSALDTFYTQYIALPGDIRNASSYWSGATDGNFDGYIKGYDTENIYAWNHLSLSEIISQSYDGTVSDYEKSIPEAALGKAYYILDTAGNLSSGHDGWTISTNPIYEKEGNFLGLGGYSDSSKVADGALTSESARAIDRKIDDGSASAGSIVFIKGTNDSGTSYASGCVQGANTAYTSATAGSIDFDLTSDEKSCRMLYFHTEYD